MYLRHTNFALAMGGRVSVFTFICVHSYWLESLSCYWASSAFTTGVESKSLGPRLGKCMRASKAFIESMGTLVVVPAAIKSRKRISP